MSVASDASKKPQSLRVKEFKVRNSPLTDRFEHNEDIKTIYNLFAIILIGLLINTIIHDYTKTGELHFGFRLIKFVFNKFDLCVLIWCILNFLSCLVYGLFHFWAQIRLQLKPKSCRLWDQIWLTILIFYYIGSLYGVQKLVGVYGLAPGSAVVLLLEKVRLVMKEHSFVRTNAPLIVHHKPHSDQKLILPNMQQFTYFLFAPTLIYRSEYPRTERIRWKFVIYNLMEVLSIVFLLSLVVERFLIPPFEEFGLRRFRISEIVIPVIGNSFPGILALLCGFYSILHSTQNAFAEMLRFGDRLFYREWWTSRSLSEYYRTWNVVVHDWLFTYIYKDVYGFLVPRNRMAAKLAVFMVSAVVHEWIVSVSLGLFLPIQFTEFFIAGALLSLLNILDLPVGNLVVWYALVMASGIQVNMYTLEFLARYNCPLVENATSLEFFMPRFLTCNCIDWYI